MTTEADVLARVRLELADPLTPFESTVVGDGVTRRYELPSSPVSASTVLAFLTAATPGAVPTATTGFTLDVDAGVITLQTPLGVGDTLTVRGSASKYFTDDELLLFIRTAVGQHLNNRGLTLATMPPVEDYLVALLATVEALYALMNDAAFDIDVSTPEGVGIPRSQRFRQLQEMVEIRKSQYTEMASALNVGLNRIEVTDLRRVSRSTGRLVPVYLSQELEDRQPPVRVFTPIDTHGVAPIVDPNAVVDDISIYEYGYFTYPLVLGRDVTNYKVDARIRRYKDSSSLREFTVTVNDALSGAIELDLTPSQTGQLPQKLFWDLRLTNRITREVILLRKGAVTVIQQVGVDESVGPVAPY
jgi:hypothetical protein